MPLKPECAEQSQERRALPHGSWSWSRKSTRGVLDRHKTTRSRHLEGMRRRRSSSRDSRLLYLQCQSTVVAAAFFTLLTNHTAVANVAAALHTCAARGFHAFSGPVIAPDKPCRMPARNAKVGNRHAHRQPTPAASASANTAAGEFSRPCCECHGHAPCLSIEWALTSSHAPWTDPA